MRKMLHRFNAFSDGPPSDFAVLDRLFPKSKFVLNVREFDEWCLSRMKHIARKENTGWTPVPNSNWRISEESVASWLTDRNAYHTRIMKYFRDRPEDLLVINFVRDPDAGQKIADFLEKKRSVSRHFANAANGRGGDLAHVTLLDNVLAAHGLTTKDARNDILNLPQSDSTPLPRGHVATLSIMSLHDSRSSNIAANSDVSMGGKRLGGGGQWAKKN